MVRVIVYSCRLPVAFHPAAGRWIGESPLNDSFFHESLKSVNEEKRRFGSVMTFSFEVAIQ